MPAKLVKEPKEVKVRKVHTCWGCGKIIKKGEKAIVTTCVNYDGIYDIYECPKCHQYYENNCLNCEDIEFCVGEHYYIGALKDCRRELNND